MCPSSVVSQEENLGGTVTVTKADRTIFMIKQGKQFVPQYSVIFPPFFVTLTVHNPTACPVQ